MNLGMERLFDYQVEDDDKTALIADEEVTSFIAHVTAWKLQIEIRKISNLLRKDWTSQCYQSQSSQRAFRGKI